MHSRNTPFFYTPPTVIKQLINKMYA